MNRWKRAANDDTRMHGGPKLRGKEGAAFRRPQQVQELSEFGTAQIPSGRFALGWAMRPLRSRQIRLARVAGLVLCSAASMLQAQSSPQLAANTSPLQVPGPATPFVLTPAVFAGDLFAGNPLAGDGGTGIAAHETLAATPTGTAVAGGTATSLPDAPQPSAGYHSSSLDAENGDGVYEPQAAGSAAKSTTNPNDGAPSKRILFIVPNYRSVRVGAKLPPQSAHEKFHTAFQDTFDPADFALAALVAAYDYGTSATPEFGTGGVGYGRYYWHALADQGIENMSVEFLVPVLTHEDTRYYTLGSGAGVGKRLGYSLSRVLITRTDAGHESANLSELLGAGLAAGASSLYYPSRERTAGKVLDNYGLNLGIDAASFLLREFDSDIARIVSRKHPQGN